MPVASGNDINILMRVKTKINWKLTLLFLVVTGGLIFLTHSFLMSLGILLLLFVGDHFAQEFDERRKRKSERTDNTEGGKHI